MKILVVSQCFWPDTFMVNDIVATLVERGHEVTVLTGLPDCTTSTIPSEYRHGLNRRQTYKGAKVYRCPTIARHHGPIWRSINYISFVISGLCYATFLDWEDFDIIYVWQVSPLTMAVPAIKLKKRYGKPLFLYCLDIWPECLKAMHIGERNPLFKVVQMWSKYIYSKCDHIAVSSTPFIDYLENENDCSRSRMSYLPQYEISQFQNCNFEKIPNGHYDFLFLGNIGGATDVSVILKACQILKQSEMHDIVTVHIVGNGSAYEDCCLLAQELNLGQLVKFYGAVGLDKTPDFYQLADACLLTLNGDSRIGDTLPGKLQTYMSAGKTVLAAINGAGKEIIEKSKCGACVAAGDAKGLAELMIDFVSNRLKYKECGLNARKFCAREFSKVRHMETLEAELRNLIEVSDIAETYSI